MVNSLNTYIINWQAKIGIPMQPSETDRSGRWFDVINKLNQAYLV